MFDIALVFVAGSIRRASMWELWLALERPARGFQGSSVCKQWEEQGQAEAGDHKGVCVNEYVRMHNDIPLN